jgi:hypothetical protein
VKPSAASSNTRWDDSLFFRMSLIWEGGDFDDELLPADVNRRQQSSLGSHATRTITPSAAQSYIEH